MPALTPQQTHARLDPTGTTPANYYKPTGVKQPTSQTVAAAGGIVNPLAAVGQWFTGLWNTFAIVGGWLANPIRLVKMAVGIILIGVALFLLIAEPEIKQLPSQIKGAARAAVGLGV